MLKRRTKGSFKSIKYKDLAYFLRNGGTAESLYKENHGIVNGLPTVLNYVDLPNAALYTNKIFRVLNIGIRGSLWISNGVRWVVATKNIVIALIKDPITLAAAASNYQTMFSYLFPTNGTDSMLRVGDRFRLSTHFNKNSTIDNYGRGFSVGPTTNSGLHPSYTSPVNGQADASVVPFDCSGNANASSTSWDERHTFVRLSGSLIKKIGALGSQSINGIASSLIDNTADLSLATPSITNIDLNPLYFNVCFATNASDSGTLKFLMLEFLPYSGN